MADPEKPLPPNVYKGDCPKDGVYIITKGNGKFDVGSMPWPVVVEGGEGDDELHVTGSVSKGMYVDGGPGNDKLRVENHVDTSSGKSDYELYAPEGVKQSVHVDGGARKEKPPADKRADTSFLTTIGDELAYLRVSYGIDVPLIATGFIVTMAVVGALGWRALGGGGRQ